MVFKIYSDGSHNKEATITKSAVRILGLNEPVELTRVGGPGWSDIAEYNGILLGLEWLIEHKAENETIDWYCDNQFIVRQLTGVYRIRLNKSYTPLALKAQEMKRCFKNIRFHWIPREQNELCDAISKL